MLRTPLLLTLMLSVGCAARDPLLEGVRSSKVTAGELELHTIFGLPPFRDAPMPVYLVIRNLGGAADTLEGARSPATAAVMLHGGEMASLTVLPIPPGDSLVLAPGRHHLMLAPPLPAIARGDSVEVVLRFSRAGEVRLLVPVVHYAEADLLR